MIITLENLKYKLSKCLWEIKDSKGCMTMLETIPIENRTLKIHQLLGKIYQERKLKK